MKYLLGNWKMNMSYREIEQFAKDFSTTGLSNVYVGIAVPSVYFGACFGMKNGMNIGLQNCSEHDDGAYTGEISAKMVADVLADFCLVGHSERRQYFGETDEIVNEKIKKLQKFMVTTVLCVGETLEQYEAGKTKEILASQVEKALVDAHCLNQIIVAYEPVWAIGTGKTPTTAEIEDCIQFLQDKLYEIKGKKIPVVYGGSVKPSNIDEILAIDCVDGVLVGGASQKAEDFTALKNAFIRRQN